MFSIRFSYYFMHSYILVCCLLFLSLLLDFIIESCFSPFYVCALYLFDLCFNFKWERETKQNNWPSNRLCLHPGCCPPLLWRCSVVLVHKAKGRILFKEKYFLFACFVSYYTGWFLTFPYHYHFIYSLCRSIMLFSFIFNFDLFISFVLNFNFF